jgi:hypothetical protein
VVRHHDECVEFYVRVMHRNFAPRLSGDHATTAQLHGVIYDSTEDARPARRTDRQEVRNAVAVIEPFKPVRLPIG